MRASFCMHVVLSLDILSFFIILRETSCIADALVLLKKVSPSRRVTFGSEKRVKLDCRLLRSECKQHGRSPAGQRSARLIYLTGVVLMYRSMGAELSAGLRPFEEGKAAKIGTPKNSFASHDGGLHFWKAYPFHGQR